MPLGIQCQLAHTVSAGLAAGCTSPFGGVQGNKGFSVLGRLAMPRQTAIRPVVPLAPLAVF
jgi:hypothetical protein